VDDDAEGVPVVESGALELAIVDSKAERLDEVERAARRGAEARDVPRVRRDLGLDEDDVQRCVADGFERDEAIPRLRRQRRTAGSVAFASASSSSLRSRGAIK
jgi:hypothetical protein